MLRQCGIANGLRGERPPAKVRPTEEAPVKHHLLTSVILLAALTCYLLGFAGFSVVGFAAGALTEFWFWARLVRGRPTQAAGPVRPGYAVSAGRVPGADEVDP
jgi:predicted exporter